MNVPSRIGEKIHFDCDDEKLIWDGISYESYFSVIPCNPLGYKPVTTIVNAAATD